MVPMTWRMNGLMPSNQELKFAVEGILALYLRLTRPGAPIQSQVDEQFMTSTLIFDYG